MSDFNISPGLSPATGDTPDEPVYVPGPTPQTPTAGRGDGIPDADPYSGDLRLRPGAEKLLMEDQLTGMTGRVPEMPEKERLNFDWADVAIAGQMQYNTVTAGAVNLQERILSGEEDLPWGEYDPYENLDGLAGYPLELFNKSRSPAQTERIKRQYDRDYYVDRIAAESGFEGIVSSVAAGAMNPLYLIPYFGWGRSASMLRTGGEVALGEAITEGAFHAGLDLTRTPEESAFNIIAGGVFGSILGGLASRGRISQDEYKQIMENLSNDMKAVEEFVGPPRPGEMQKVHSYDGRLGPLAELPDVDKISGRFSKLASKLTPLRVLASESSAARKLGALLGEQTVVGTTRTAIETAVKRYDANLAKGLNALHDSYRAYKFRNPKDALSRVEFSEEVTRALRNGDEHIVGEIQTAARKIRREVLEPIKKRAVEVGLLKSEDDLVKFSKSYFPRQYNFGKIQSERGQFIADISKYIEEANPGIEKMDAVSTAREVARKITDSPMDQIFHRDVSVTAGPLKGRKVAVPDNVLSKWLVNEPDVVLRSWSNDLASQIEFHRMFGDTSLKRQLAEVEDDWNRKIEEASLESPEKAGKLERQKADDLETLRALRDRLQNRYKLPDNPKSAWVRAGRAARNLNILRLLGGMTISAFPDMARPLYKHGLGTYSKAISAITTDPALRKMARADLERMGVGLDLTLNSRLRAIAEADYMPVQYSKPEAWLDSMVTGSGGKYPDFGRVSLMSHWNSSLKMLTGMMAQDGLIRAVGKNQINFKKLKESGITPEMAQRIKSEVAKHGTETSGLRFANSDQWTDFEAAELFESAILREVDATIVTPGIMDKPLWMSSEMGKVIGQLKSFGFAATNKQLLSGLNNFSGYFIQGALASVTLGALTYTIKRRLAGAEPDTEPEELLLKGIEYSGVIGIGSEAIQFGAGTLQGMGLYKGDGNWRWARQGMWGSTLGPSAGLVEDAIRANRAFFRDEPNAGDIEALRRMLPYNNLFQIRLLFDEAEQMTKDRLRIPD